MPFWPSWTMKAPLASHTRTAMAATAPTVMPAPLSSPPPPPPPLPPPPLLRFLLPNRPFRRWLKSRHSWSRSGGPSPGFLPSWACLLPSLSEPQRGSLSDSFKPILFFREEKGMFLVCSDMGKCGNSVRRDIVARMGVRFPLVPGCLGDGVAQQAQSFARARADENARNFIIFITFHRRLLAGRA